MLKVVVCLIGLTCFALSQQYDPYEMERQDERYSSSPDIIIGPSDAIVIDFDRDRELYALCSTSSTEQFEISWIRRYRDDSVETLSSNRELVMRNIGPSDLASPIFCRVTNRYNGATYEKQLVIQSPQLTEMARPMLAPVDLRLTIEPLPAEDMDNGQIARRCHFEQEPVSVLGQFDFRWIDQNGRVLTYEDTLYMRVRDPLELGNYTCEATNKQTGATYQARYRVSRQIVPPSSASVEYRRGRDYTVSIRKSTDEIVIGQPFVLTCEVSPSPTEPVTFMWYYENQLVARDTPVFRIDSVDIADLGQYVCQAQWRGGSGNGMMSGYPAAELATNATLQINLALTQATEIDLAPPPGSTMVTMEGVFKELHCEYERGRPTSVQWFFQDQPLEYASQLNATGHVFRIDRQLVSIIAINGTEVTHQGQYKCIVDGLVKIANLIVRSDVGLIVNPPRQTVNVGEAAEIHCRIERSIATNRDLLWFYQPFESDYIRPLDFTQGSWQRDDHSITSLTSFITTNYARKSDEGQYICRHRESGTEARGLLYVVKQTRPYRLTISPQVVRVRSNEPISITCNLIDELGQSVAYAPEFRLADSRIRYSTNPVGRSEVRLDISQGLSIEFNGTQVECFYGSDTVTSLILIEDTCPPGYRRCRSGQCIPAGHFCDGIRHCNDGSDEDSTYCTTCSPITKTCGVYQGRQPLKSTYMVHWTCDGEDDCGNNYDESMCEEQRASRCTEAAYRCSNDYREIPWSFVCDGDTDCANGEDERYCGPPVVQTPHQVTYRARVGSTVSLTCRVTGNPLPYVIWRFNWNCLPEEGGRFRVYNVAEECSSTMPTVVSTLTITNVQPGDDVIYNCEGLAGTNRAMSTDFRLIIDY